jgi:hypothetical protein
MADRAELAKNAATQSPDSAHDPSNPRVFFDIRIGGVDSGRIVFEVRTFDFVVTIFTSSFISYMVNHAANKHSNCTTFI